MSYSVKSLLDRHANKWREWSRRRKTLMALDRCGSVEMTRLAHDIGVSETDFRVLASRWPDASDLLSQRMQLMNLDVNEITRLEPEAARDLQRVCGLCASQQRCRQDLASATSSRAWRSYCPNDPTFAALTTKRRDTCHGARHKQEAM